MKDFLLVDFGASRIKAAHLIEDNIKNVNSYPSVAPCIDKNNKFEVSSLDIKNKFIKIIDQYYKEHTFQGILLCSEMHGFIIVDKNNNALSNYISWKTERSVNIYEGEQVSNFNKLSSLINEKFLAKTGMRIRACYPIFNIYDMAKSGEFNGGKIISLPEWLCCCDGKSTNKAHITMSAGMGFYNINNDKFDEDLIKIIDKPICFNEVVKDIEIGGYLNIRGNELPIYTGVGDHQCAVLGAGNTINTISVNLGTGSQVAMIKGEKSLCERVPYFAGKTLSVIKHIPSGRMFNCFMNFFKSINPQENFWDKMDNLKVSDILKSDLNMNLSIFKSAWNYENGGCISGINEGNFTEKNFLASIIKNYIMQYKVAIDELSPDKNHNKIILSGGIPAKIPIVKEYLAMITGYDVSYNHGNFDETILGLKIIKNKYLKGVN